MSLTVNSWKNLKVCAQRFIVIEQIKFNLHIIKQREWVYEILQLNTIKSFYFLGPHYMVIEQSLDQKHTK